MKKKYRITYSTEIEYDRLFTPGDRKWFENGFHDFISRAFDYNLTVEDITPKPVFKVGTIVSASGGGTFPGYVKTEKGWVTLSHATLSTFLTDEHFADDVDRDDRTVLFEGIEH